METVSLREWVEGELRNLAAAAEARSRGNREYMEQRIVAVADATMARFEADQRALEMAAESIKAHLAGMNEFRGAMGDAASKYASIETMDAKLGAIEARITGLEKIANNLHGRMTMIGVGAVLLSLLIAGGGLLLNYLSR